MSDSRPQELFRRSSAATESTAFVTVPPTPLTPGTPAIEHTLAEAEASRDTVPAAAPVATHSQTSDRTDSDDTSRGSPTGRAHQRQLSGHSISVGALDPEGTAELTRRLTQSSSKPTATSDEDAGKVEEGTPTFNPFDDKGTFDLEHFLRHVFQRSSERGTQSREMGVAFRNLSVTGVGSGVALSNSMSSLLLEPFRSLANIRQMFNPPVRKILHEFTGSVKPGEMLLVLGRPGAGCTSFLKSIASYRDGFKDITGDISYEGFSHKAIDGMLRGDVCYIPEDDSHFATLTVAQTLEFAA
ncbi:unnamed protein product, partial [Tilletia laevis]